MEGCVVVVVVVGDVGSRYRKVASECQAPTSRSTSALTIHERDGSLGINIKECLYAAYIYYKTCISCLTVYKYTSDRAIRRKRKIYYLHLSISLKEHWNITHL